MKRKSSLKRKLKYLFLLLLISFSFSFTFGHINKLNQEINRLNQTMQQQAVRISQSELDYKQLKGEVNNQGIKINILAKKEPVKIVERVVEQSTSLESRKVDLTNPVVTVTALSVATKMISEFTHGILHKVGVN